MFQFLQSLRNHLNRFQWLSLLLVRAVIAFIFIQAGWGKLNHLSGVINYFDSLGIPLASIQAPMVATLEFIGGLLILSGIWTRLASLLLWPIMVVAILTAQLENITNFHDLMSLGEFHYLIMLSILIIQGGGRASVAELLRHTKVGKLLVTIS